MLRLMVSRNSAGAVSRADRRRTIYANLRPNEFAVGAEPVRRRTFAVRHRRTLGSAIRRNGRRCGGSSWKAGLLQRDLLAENNGSVAALRRRPDRVAPCDDQTSRGCSGLGGISRSKAGSFTAEVILSAVRWHLTLPIRYRGSGVHAAGPGRWSWLWRLLVGPTNVGRLRGEAAMIMVTGKFGTSVAATSGPRQSPLPDCSR